MENGQRIVRAIRREYHKDAHVPETEWIASINMGTKVSSQGFGSLALVLGMPNRATFTEGVLVFSKQFTIPKVAIQPI